MKERLELGIKPMNLVDRGSMDHDIAYGHVQDQLKEGVINEQMAAKAIRKADLDLINAIEMIPASSRPPDDSASWVKQIMSLKMQCEDLGLMKPLHFIKSAV